MKTWNLKLNPNRPDLSLLSHGDVPVGGIHSLSYSLEPRQVVKQDGLFKDVTVPVLRIEIWYPDIEVKTKR